jgi:histidinol-phosphate aminotransferase
MRYPDPMANAFRHRAADVLGVPPDWLLCGNGSDDLLTIVTRAFVGQGFRLRLPYPSYLLYKTLAQLQGAEAEEVRFRDDWSLPPEFGYGDPGLKLVFLANPNSPTGTVVSREAVLELAERLPCPIVVDEAYVDFADTNCVELVARNEKILVARTLSKSYSLAGLRFGFLVAQPRIIVQLIKVKDSYNCDALSIAGATAAIDDQGWLRQNLAKIQTTRTRTTGALRQLGFAVLPSQANFVWAAHPQHPARSLYEQLKQNRILVRYMDYPHWGDGLRITVGTDEQMDALVAVLQSLV